MTTRILAFASVLTISAADAATAQCIGDLPSELVGLSAAVEAIVGKLTPDNEGNVTKQSVSEAVGEPSTYSGAVSAAGTATASCLVARYDVFAEAVETALEEQPPELASAAVRTLLTRATSAALSDRYSPTGGTFQLFFGLGFATAIETDDIEQFKIVKRTSATPVVDGEPALQDSSFVIRESNSEGIPSAMTGLLVKFTDRRLAAGFVPTAVFASAQITGGDVGLINGAALGIGWRLAGQAYLLVGYSLARTKSLREDLRAEFENTPNGRLPLAPGETEESILGTETANFWTISLGVPISLGTSLGSG